VGITGAKSLRGITLRRRGGNGRMPPRDRTRRKRRQCAKSVAAARRFGLPSLPDTITKVPAQRATTSGKVRLKEDTIQR